MTHTVTKEDLYRQISLVIVNAATTRGSKSITLVAKPDDSGIFAYFEVKSLVDGKSTEAFGTTVEGAVTRFNAIDIEI